MKLLLVLLLLTSCASKRKLITEEPNKPKCAELNFINKMELCMMKFSKQGYDSDGIVRICGKIYERRD